jgi:hypothetical protein
MKQYRNIRGFLRSLHGINYITSAKFQEVINWVICKNIYVCQLTSDTEALRDIFGNLGSKKKILE